MSCRAHGAAADFRTTMTRSSPLYGKLASGAPPLDSHHHPLTGPHWTKVTVKERPKSGKGMVSKPVSEPSIPSGMRIDNPLENKHSGAGWTALCSSPYRVAGISAIHQPIRPPPQ